MLFTRFVPWLFVATLSMGGVACAGDVDNDEAADAVSEAVTPFNQQRSKKLMDAATLLARHHADSSLKKWNDGELKLLKSVGLSPQYNDLPVEWAMWIAAFAREARRINPTKAFREQEIYGRPLVMAALEGDITLAIVRDALTRRGDVWHGLDAALRSGVKFGGSEAGGNQATIDTWLRFAAGPDEKGGTMTYEQKRDTGPSAKTLFTWEVSDDGQVIIAKNPVGQNGYAYKGPKVITYKLDKYFAGFAVTSLSSADVYISFLR